MKISRRKIVRIGLGLAVLLGGFALVHLVGHGSHVDHAQNAVYTCPMHPTYTSDRPGDCPICGMKLVKREGQPAKAAEEGGLGGGSTAGYVPILVSPQKQQMIGIRTGLVEKRKMAKTIRTVGQIAYDPELYQAEQEYLQVLSGLKNGNQSSISGVAEQAKGLAEAARMRLRLLGLSAGFIEEVSKWDGPDKRLLLADSKGEVWLYAPVYEFEMPLVKEGQEIQIEIPAAPGKTLKGTIRSIDSVLDPMTRSARVRALLSDPESMLRPQMYVNASIEIALGEVLGLPAEAVLDAGSRKIVFVDKGQGLFDPREVTVGVKADGFYELKGGVSEGERVVVSGNFLIDSESRLKSALEGMSGGSEHKHGQ